MGWGISFTPEIYISRERFDNVEEINDKIEELTASVNDSKQEISMLVLATPKDIMPVDEEDPMDPTSYLQVKLNEIFEYMEENQYKLTLFRMLKEHIEENGIEKISQG